MESSWDRSTRIGTLGPRLPFSRTQARLAVTYPRASGGRQTILRTPAHASEPRTAVSPCRPPGGCTGSVARAGRSPRRARPRRRRPLPGSKVVEPMLTKDPTPRPSPTAYCLYRRRKCTTEREAHEGPRGHGRAPARAAEKRLTRRSTAQSTTADAHVDRGSRAHASVVATTQLSQATSPAAMAMKVAALPACSRLTCHHAV